jgi:hypothetical protein
MDDDESKSELVKQAHRKVYKAISALVDVVEEPFLLDKVGFLKI